ncbi:sodium:solute symporter family protein [Halobacillus aidingensis]|uniref:Sodium/proline symporter n=1 Tax=Halobacillus aidingensis TaxID=240303 RepID=A0A1H0H377_HALAD|nr:sodium:pantothenate symporter [Halobacillus aidingensis]SDO13540.1 sodium/proline symporter [Halobacillus aidingensis]
MAEVQIMMWIGLVLLLIIIGYLGYLGYKKTNTVSDFSIAGESLGPVILGLAYAATFFSASTFIGYPGWAYQWGFSSIWIFLTLIIASPLGLIVVAKRARKMNMTQKSLSLADWLGDRYNSDFIRVGTALVCLFNIFYIAAQFAAGAWIFNTLLDIPYTIGLIIIAVLVVAYVYTGGSYADIYTDAAQAVLMAIMGVLVFISVFWMFPGGLTEGFTSISQTLADRDPSMVSLINPSSIVFYSVPAIIGAFIIQFAFSSQPQLFNKVLALKDPRDMRKMIMVYVFASFCFILVIFGGLFASVTVTVDEIDQAILSYVLQAFPPIVAAFLGIVVIAAAMSTTDGIFVVMSTLVANDIYRKFLVPRGYVKATQEQADRTALKISRYSVLVVGVISFILVLNPPASIGMFIWIGISGVASGTLGPLLVGLFFPNIATTSAAKISLVSGVGAYVLIIILNFEKSTMAAGAWAVLVGVFAMLVAGYMTKNKEASLDSDVRETM